MIESKSAEEKKMVKARLRGESGKGKSSKLGMLINQL